MKVRTLISLPLLFLTLVSYAETAYEARYVARVQPADGIIAVELQLKGAQLPTRITFNTDPRRHRNFRSNDPLDVSKDAVIWRPKGRSARISYEFVVNHERRPGRYDSRMTANWALFRGDRLVPSVAVASAKELHSRASLRFELPPEWSSTTAYATQAPHDYLIEDPQRRFDRPKGWMLLGKIGVRSEDIKHVKTIVAAPVGDSARRQDALAFLNWNLPRLLEVFPDFPSQVLIVSAADPMWRGGLSGPASLFLHADMPLISENRTSTLLHELVHVAMGIRGDHESDWIVEGFAEYFSIETLRRSGGISARRYDQAMQALQKRGASARTLFARESSAERTARAVVALKAVDDEIRALTQNRASLDEVARELAKRRGEVSLERLQTTAAKVAGRPLKTLERAVLERSN